MAEISETQARVNAIKVRAAMHGLPVTVAETLDYIDWTPSALDAWERPATIETFKLHVMTAALMIAQKRNQDGYDPK